MSDPAARDHDVFISYSTRDRDRADALCVALEDAGLRCWIAPRNGEPGVAYAQFLVEAIAASRIVVLLFTRAANDSEAVLNELEIAANRGVPVLPIRAEALEPSGAAEYYLRRRHWLDAFDDFAAVLQSVAPAVRAILDRKTVAPRARTGPRQRNLPRQGTRFIGRAHDVERITALLDTEQLVTIAGPGGVGKTRLALQAALERDDFGDEVWFIDLAPLANAALVVPTILAAIGAADAGQRSPLERLVETLADRHAGVILDNCEHVVGAAAEAAAAILRGCPNVKLLATSRESLNVPGEAVYRLHPFDVPTAVLLFCERASAANPLFELTATNAATIEAICRRLDGLALAIELAAARVRVISIDELSRRLSERFRLLTGGNRTALPHQQTLRALIDWSYDVLAADEAALFRRMAVFGGTFTLDAVSAVGGFDPIDPWSMLDLLASLVDKSLVIAEIDDAGQRYHLLQSIHEYAQARLVGEEARDVARRHAEFFAGFAGNAYAEWDRDPGPDWLGRARAEVDNLRAALTWALDDAHDVALGAQLAADAVPVFLRLSRLGEGLAWCEKALAASAIADPAAEGRLRYGMSMLYNNRVDLRAAMREVALAVACYRNANDARGLVRALSQYAQQSARQGRYDDAVTNASEALASAREMQDQRLLAATLQRCAVVFRPEEIHLARADFTECVELYRALGRDEDTARALSWWVSAEVSAGEFERAIELSIEASRLAAHDERQFVVNNIAACAIALGDRDRAAPAAREALVLAIEQNSPAMIANAVAYLAAIAVLSNPADAARLFGYSQARFAVLASTPDKTDEIRVERLLSELHERFDVHQVQTLIREGAALADERAVALAATI